MLGWPYLKKYLDPQAILKGFMIIIINDFYHHYCSEYDCTVCYILFTFGVWEMVGSFEIRLILVEFSEKSAICWLFAIQHQLLISYSLIHYGCFEPQMAIHKPTAHGF